jgi:hypothetical protein
MLIWADLDFNLAGRTPTEGVGFLAARQRPSGHASLYSTKRRRIEPVSCISSMLYERIFQAPSNRRTQNNGPVCSTCRATKPLFRSMNGFPGNGPVIDLAIGQTPRSIT